MNPRLLRPIMWFLRGWRSVPANNLFSIRRERAQNFAGYRRASNIRAGEVRPSHTEHFRTGGQLRGPEADFRCFLPAESRRKRSESLTAARCEKGNGRLHSGQGCVAAQNPRQCKVFPVMACVARSDTWTAACLSSRSLKK